jgi:hypothetical protein
LTWLSRRRPGQGRRSLFLGQHDLLGLLRVELTGFLRVERTVAVEVRPGPVEVRSESLEVLGV